jgi:hypothetical protein
MTPRRRLGRHAICDSVRATGDAHRLGPSPILLIVDGRTLTFCSMVPCLISYVCNVPYDDLPMARIGQAERWPA